MKPIEDLSFAEPNLLFSARSSFDKENTGKISEKCFRTIMVNKDDVTEKDVDEMLEEYYRWYFTHKNAACDFDDRYILTMPKHVISTVIYIF